MIFTLAAAMYAVWDHLWLAWCHSHAPLTLFWRGRNFFFPFVHVLFSRPDGSWASYVDLMIGTAYRLLGCKPLWHGLSLIDDGFAEFNNFSLRIWYGYCCFCFPSLAGRCLCTFSRANWRELSTLARISLYPSSLFFDTGRFLVGSIEVKYIA